MPDWSTLMLFAVAASILVFTPGPNTLSAHHASRSA